MLRLWDSVGLGQAAVRKVAEITCCGFRLVVSCLRPVRRAVDTVLDCDAFDGVNRHGVSAKRPKNGSPDN